MNIPSSLVVTNCAYLTDGGSIYLDLIGTDGAKHTLLVPQHGVVENFRRLGKPPGALIFDDELLSVRGAEEAALVAALRSATYAESRSSQHEGITVAPRTERIVIGDDLKEYVDAIDKGPGAAMRLLVGRVLSFVGSAEYLEVAKRHGRLA